MSNQNKQHKLNLMYVNKIIQDLNPEQKKINILSTSVEDRTLYVSSMSTDKFQTMKSLLLRQTIKRPS